MPFALFAVFLSAAAGAELPLAGNLLPPPAAPAASPLEPGFFSAHRCPAAAGLLPDRGLRPGAALNGRALYGSAYGENYGGPGSINDQAGAVLGRECPSVRGLLPDNAAPPIAPATPWISDERP